MHTYISFRMNLRYPILIHPKCFRMTQYASSSTRDLKYTFSWLKTNKCMQQYTNKNMLICIIIRPRRKCLFALSGHKFGGSVSQSPPFFFFFFFFFAVVVIYKGIWKKVKCSVQFCLILLDLDLKIHKVILKTVSTLLGHELCKNDDDEIVYDMFLFLFVFFSFFLILKNTKSYPWLLLLILLLFLLLLFFDPSLRANNQFFFFRPNEY